MNPTFEERLSKLETGLTERVVSLEKKVILLEMRIFRDKFLVNRASLRTFKGRLEDDHEVMSETILLLLNRYGVTGLSAEILSYKLVVYVYQLICTFQEVSENLKEKPGRNPQKCIEEFVEKIGKILIDASDLFVEELAKNRKIPNVAKILSSMHRHLEDPELEEFSKLLRKTIIDIITGIPQKYVNALPENEREEATRAFEQQKAESEEDEWEDVSSDEEETPLLKTEVAKSC